MLHVRFAFLPVALMALACSESVESTDVRTTGIYPEIEVVATGNGNSKVTVRLKVGGDDSNTFLDLTGEDKLEASVGDETKALDQSGNEYSASFAEDAEGTEFVVSFTRGGEDDDAPASTVTMPAPFTMELEVSEASRAEEDVKFAWEPGADGDMDWSYSGDCVKSRNGSTPDDGVHVIAAGDIETFDSDKEESCTVELSLTRAQGGTIDPAFTEGGSIVAKHVRGDSFTSNP